MKFLEENKKENNKKVKKTSFESVDLNSRSFVSAKKKNKIAEIDGLQNEFFANKKNLWLTKFREAKTKIINFNTQRSELKFRNFLADVVGEIRKFSQEIQLNSLKLNDKKTFLAFIVVLLVTGFVAYKTTNISTEIPEAGTSNLEITESDSGIIPYDQKIDKTEEGYSVDFSQIKTPQEEINVGKVNQSAIKNSIKITKDDVVVKDRPQLGTDVVYGSHDLHFDEAKISIKKTSEVNAIIRCDVWNEKINRCDGDWKLDEEIAWSQDDGNILLTVNHFSAYAGAYLDIINLQSNLYKGDTWTVNFQTYSQSDLVIAAVDGTHRGTDLAFQGIYCGDTQIDSSLIVQNGDIITVKNYQCDGQVSNIKNTAVTAGRHWQAFTFGDTVGALAHNFACDNTGGSLDGTCQVTSTQTLANGDSLSGSGNLIIASGGILTAAIGNRFEITMTGTGSVTVQSGGSITGNVTITAATLTVDSGGSIVVTGKGYATQAGTGASTSGGGSYGGNGSTTGVTYGSAIAPADLGSGGASTYSANGGAGGGAVKAIISGATTINGTIYANGNAGVSLSDGYTTYYGAGGSGGSVWIATATLAGTGSITANGGAGVSSVSDSGGGGRIALIYNSISSGSITKQAYGGSTALIYGGAGTIYTKASGTNGTLTVNNGSINGLSTTQTDASLTFDTVSVTAYAKYVIPASTSLTTATFTSDANSGLTINSGGTFNYSGTTLSNLGTLSNSGTLSVPNLTTLSSITTFTNNAATLNFPALTTITSVGLVNAASKTINFNAVATVTVTSGSFTNSGTITFVSGSTLNFKPTTFTNNSGATFTLPTTSTFTNITTATNAGTISAGSSSSVGILTITTFNNSGTLTLPATTTISGVTTFNNSGAISGVTSLTVTGATTFNHTGTMADLVTLTIGGSGTTYFYYNKNTNWSFGNLIITSGGILSHAANSATSTKTYAIDFTLSGNLTISGTGTINVDGKGFSAGYGPGVGGVYSTYYGAGGGYGGAGGYSYGSTTNGGAANGSMIEPNTLGSGGGTVYGGAGGGAVKIVAAGTVTLGGGAISANGGVGISGGSGGGGGGSGGSVWIGASTLSGSSSISANGGNGYSTSSGGGGGGGRIALYTSTNSYTGTRTVTGGTGYNAGSVGTNFLDTTSPNLTVANVCSTSASSLDSNIDFASSSNYVQQDGTNGTSFSGGTVQMKQSTGSGVDSYTTLMLHANGTNGTAAFLDSSITTKIQTPYGNAQISTAQSKFGGASGLFDGTGDYVTTPYVSSYYDWWSSDYTIDAWIRPAAFSSYDTNQPNMVGNMNTGGSTNYWSFGPTSDGKLAFFYVSSGSYVVKSSGTLSLNQWTHVAMTQTGSTIRLYINGSVDGTGTITGTPTSSSGVVLTVGDHYTSGFNGYIDELRISKGIARWAANFTPPTSAYTSSDYPTTQSYYITTTTGSELKVSEWSHVSKVTLTQTTPISTSIKYLVSFDGRNTWKYFDGSVWQATTLDNTNLQTYGMTKTTMEAITQTQWEASGGFVSGDTATLNFAADLKTTDWRLTPSLDNIALTGVPIKTSNSCTTAGASASPQQAYYVGSFTGTSQDSDSGVNELVISIQDVTTGVNLYYNGYNGFDQASEYWITPTISPSLPTSSAVAWTYNASTIPFVSNHTYAVKARSKNGGSATVVTKQFTFYNLSPTVSSVTASQSDEDGLVRVSYGIADNEATSTTVKLTYFSGSTLLADVNATSTADVALSDVSLLPSSGYLVLDDEVIRYTGKSTAANTLTGIGRGIFTTNAVHTANTAAYLVANAVTGDVGTTTSGTGKSIIWTPKTDINGLYISSFAIKVLANDGASSSMIGQGTSSAFEIDTEDPVVTVYVDGSVQYGTNPSRVYVAMTDDTIVSGTRGQMMLSLNSDFSSASYTAYSVTAASPTPYTTFMLDNTGDTDTLYWKFRDSKNNITSGSNTLPNKPLHYIVQDVSNTLLTVPEYALFTAWGQIDSPASGTFLRYNVLRSLTDDDTKYTKVGNTVPDRSINYYRDTGINYDTNYFYKGTAEDVNNNISFRSNSAWGVANGTQDAGEGGGGTEKIPPVISNVQISSISGMQAVITWDTDELSNSAVGYSTTPGPNSFGDHTKTSALVTDNDSGVGRHRIVLTGLDTNTTYYFRVSSTDPSGNVAKDYNLTADPSGQGYTFTTLNGPTISEVIAYPIRNTRATITWKTDVNSNSYVVYSLDPTMTESTTLGADDLTTSHSVAIENLTPDETYYFYVRSGYTIDDNSTCYYSFITTADTALPEITFNPATDISNVTDTKASISWSTSKAANSTVMYGTESGSYPLSSENANFNYDHRMNLIDLTPSQTYYFQMKSVDENGNTVISAEYSFTTQDVADTTGPVISDVTISNTTPTTATITWTTDEESSSFVQYATTETNFSNIYKEFGREEDSTLSHSVTLEGLDQTKTYYFKVKSIDAAGNATTDNFIALTLASGPAINTVTVTPSLTSAVLNWTTNVNSDAAVIYSVNSDFFNAQEKGIPDKTTTSHNITIDGLTSGVTYYYKVRSTGTDGGVTTKEDSEQYFSTTVDATAPVISDISTEAIAYNSAVIKWVTDEQATSQVEYGTDQSNLSSSTTLNPALNIGHAAVLTGLSANTKYYFKVISSDGNGNSSSDSSAENYFTTLMNPEYQHNPIAAITDISTLLVTDVNANIKFNTDQGAICTINYGTATGVYRQTTPAETEYSKSHSINISSLSASTDYYYKISCTDNLNNSINSEENSFTTLPSQVSHTPLSQATHDSDPTFVMETDTEAIITFNAGTTAASKLCKSTTENIDMDTCSAETPIVTNSQAHLYYLSELEPFTRYYIKMKLTDSIDAADTYTTNEVSFKTLAVQSSHTPLSAAVHDTAPSVLMKTENEAIVTFNAGTTSSSKLCLSTDAGIDGDACTAFMPELTNKKIHSYHLTGLTANEEYYLKMKLTDSDDSSDVYISEETSFTTDQSPAYQHDPLSEITNVATSLVTDKNAIITFTTDQSATCVIKYGTATGVHDQTNATEIEYNYSHAINISGLNVSTEYFYKVICTDNLNTTITTSNPTEYTFNTLAAQVGHITLTGASHDSNPTVTMETDTEAMITFNAGTAASSKICISTSASIDMSTCVEAATSITDSEIHSYHLTDLTPATTYYVKMKLTDSIDTDDIYTTGETSFDTLAIQVNHVLLSEAPHDSAPSVTMKSETEAVIVFNAGTTASSKFCYSTSDSINMETCQGESPAITDSEIHSYHITGLTANTKYYLKMKLADSIDVSDVYTSTESSFVTNQSSILVHDPLASILNISTSLVTDAKAVVTFNTDQYAKCTISYGTATGSYNQTNSNETGYNKIHSVNITDLSVSTKYYYKINCIDNLSNSLDSEENSFTTLKKQISHTPLSLASHDSNPTVTMETDTEAMITFNAGTAASSKICISTSASIDMSTCVEAATSITDSEIHSYHLTDLTPATTYYVKMKLTDSIDTDDIYTTGETSFDTLTVQSGHVAFSDATHDTSPTVVMTTDVEAIIIFDAGTSTSSKLCKATTSNIDIETCQNETPAVTNKKIHSYHLLGLSPDATYYLKMKLTDSVNASDVYVTEEIYFTTTKSAEYQHDPLSAITNVSNSIITDTTSIINFNTDQEAICTVDYGVASGSYSQTNHDEAEYSKGHAINISSLTVSTKYYYKINCTDNLNNSISSTEYFFTTLSKQVGHTPLSIASHDTNPSVTLETDTEAMVTFNAGTTATSKLCKSTTPNIDMDTCTAETASITNTKIHSYHLAGLTPSATYYVKMKLTDSSDDADTYTTGEVSFTTLAIQTSHIALSNAAHDIGPSVVTKTDTEAVVTFNAGTTASSKFCISTTSGINIDNCTGESPAIVDSEVHSYHLTNLEDATRYYLKMKLTDSEDSNDTYTSTETSFTTNESPEYQHDPLSSITSIGTSLITDTDAIVNFNTDQGAVCSIAYGTNSGTYTLENKDESEYNKGHAINLTGLTLSTTYYYKISCTDNLGTNIRSSENSFTTLAKQVSHTQLINASHDTDPTVVMKTDIEAMITFDAGTTATSKLCVATSSGIDIATCTAATPIVTNSKMHLYNLTGLTANTTYYVKMKLTDSQNAADTYTTGEISFATLPVQSGHVSLASASHDTDPTVIMKTDTEAVINFDAGTTATSKLCKSTSTGIDISACTAETPAITDKQIHSYHLSELTANTTYYLKMKLTDSVDSDDTYTSAEISFTTEKSAEYQHDALSSISNIAASLITDSDAVINFDTDQNAICFAEVTTSSGNYNNPLVFQESGYYIKKHSMKLDGLIFNTQYYYRITCEDNLNNVASTVAPIERSFTTLHKQTDHTLLSNATHDTDPTVVTKTDNEAIISFNAGTTASSKLCLSTSTGINISSCEAALAEISNSRIHSYHLTGLTPQTAYYIKMKLTDSEVSSDIYTTNEVSFVTTASQVEHTALSSTFHDTDPTVSMKTDTEAMIIFNAGTDSKSKICNSGTASIDIESCTGENSTTDTKLHTFHLTSLTAATTYYVKMKVTDSENVADTYTSKEVSFTTLSKQAGEGTSTADTTKPEISSVSVGSIGGQSVTVTWNTNEKSNSLVSYMQEGATVSMMTGDMEVNKSADNYATSHSVTILNLTSDTNYTFSVLSIDPSGNIAQSSESSFTTKGNSALSSIKVASKVMGQANITWSTNASTSSIVEYGLSTEYGKTKEDTTKTKDHEIILTELTPGETYHFRVKGEDENGNMFASSDITFQPNSPPKISDFKIDSVYEHGAKIIFNTNVPTNLVVTYIDSKNASNSGSQGQPELATKHEITLKNMASGVTYSVKVKVRDENGNETEEDFSTFTTTKDVNPPKIDNVHTDSALTQSDKVQTIITWKTDEQSTSVVSYREGRNGNEKEFKNTDNLSTNHVIVFTSLKPGTVYNFKVKSADESGNESISNYFSFLTPKQKQNIIQVIMTNFQDIFGWTGNVVK